MIVKIEKNDHIIHFDLDEENNKVKLIAVYEGVATVDSTFDLETTAIIATFATGVRNFTDAVIRVSETSRIARGHESGFVAS